MESSLYIVYLLIFVFGIPTLVYLIYSIMEHVSRIINNLKSKNKILKNRFDNLKNLD
jgi:predicted PurR-regulated permease PerM